MTPAPRRPAALLPPVRPTFRAIARTVVPETASLDAPGWARLESIVEDALADRPPRMRRQLALFVRLIDWMSLARHRRRFRSLGAEARVRILERFQDSPILLLRRGFWGLRTLIYMGWYAQPATAGRIGYAAHLRGWPARPGESATVPLPQVAPAHEVGPLPMPAGAGAPAAPATPRAAPEPLP